MKKPILSEAIILVIIVVVKEDVGRHSVTHTQSYRKRRMPKKILLSILVDKAKECSPKEASTPGLRINPRMLSLNFK